MARKSRRSTLPREKKEFEEAVIAIDRVTRVVKGGRRLRFRATVVIGDKKGRVGIGTGKSNEVTGAISKAITKAKKSLITVPLINGTIPHEVKHKFKAAKILLMPAAEGTGVKAGGAVRKVVELAGVTNILSKSFGSNNKLSTTRAAYEALQTLRENPYIKPNEKVEAKKEVKAEDKKEETKKAPAKKAAAKKTTKKADDKKETKKAPAKKAAAKKDDKKEDKKES